MKYITPRNCALMIIAGNVVFLIGFRAAGLTMVILPTLIAAAVVAQRWSFKGDGDRGQGSLPLAK